MTGERLFLDTAFVQALLNRHDQHHDQARILLPRVRTAAEVWVTEAILIEIGNALSAFNREAAAAFIEQCYHTANVRVVGVDTLLLLRALQLYQSRPDKTWGLTDCISFVVMQDQGLTAAITTDQHFAQAGYQALLSVV
jgi:predicted nucleic acid-binding protein